jgi:hypothetical protein
MTINVPYLPKDIEKQISEWYTQSIKLIKIYDDNADTPNANAFEVATKVKEEINKFKTRLPIIEALSTEALEPRHWANISEIMGEEVDPTNTEITLDFLDSKNVLK